MHVSPRSCVCVEMIRVVPTVRLADVHFNEVSESPDNTAQQAVALMIPRLNTYSQPLKIRLPVNSQQHWRCDCRACQLHGAALIRVRYDPSA